MQPTSPTPSQTVQLFLQAMETLNYAEAVKYVADDCVYTNPPPLGTVFGPKGIQVLLEPFFAPTLENEFRIVRQSQSDTIVFVERLDRHRLTDKWVELPVTGVFEVRGGLITFWRDYFDTTTIMSQWPTA
jgi:limonene-1,2-epoxide hydrolase